MAQADIKGKEIYNAQENGEAGTQSKVPADSWLIKVKSTFHPSYKMWQVSEKVCIYRVVEPIRITKVEAYVPLVISFGPYNHNSNPKLFMMDQYKAEAVHRMLARSNTDVKNLISELQNLESKIRECYAEPIPLDGEKLSWILALDACFILEFFKSFGQTSKNNDKNCFSLIFQNNDKENSMYRAILDDIIKLENQIPLCILITVLQLEFGSHENATTELAALLSFSERFHGFPLFPLTREDGKLKLKQCIENKRQPARHLLDLCRMVIKDLIINSKQEVTFPDNVNNVNKTLLPRLTPTLSPKDSRSTPTAELLHGAGIKFQPGKIRFEKRRFGRSKLSLPQIQVWDSTETWLRNLIAYEECQRCSWSPEQTLISQYVILLDHLIDSEKDVCVLRKCQVIEGWVGSDEDIAKMFNRLADGLTFVSITEFEEVKRVVRDYYNSPWVWISQFKDEYWSKPWYVFSLVAAVLILGMTAVQTVYSVKK